MIDPAVTKISQWIVLDLIPTIKAFFTEYFSTNIFTTMTTEELQIYFMKIALYAVLFIVLYKIGLAWARLIKRKKRRSKRPISRSKKIWSPTGWYWDEKKQKWTPPDYLSKESENRWKWDPEKQIWIDLNPPKDE